MASQNTFGLSAGTTNQQLSNPSLVLPKQQSANWLLSLPGTTNQQSADQNQQSADQSLGQIAPSIITPENEPTIIQSRLLSLPKQQSAETTNQQQ